MALKAPMSLSKLTQAEYFVNSGNLKERLIPLSEAIEQSQNIFKATLLNSCGTRDN
ncbi:hypothetical protein [Planktothrix sp. FACHB-1355]|uniref:hypothetical protein n=1 Tax=Planktothrix sp. FACHB-1355 TaxID=2692854 RepID=UPI00168BB261|nr:hypothetical protein [Planktothrix sp. FACHB-1355]